MSPSNASFLNQPMSRRALLGGTGVLAATSLLASCASPSPSPTPGGGGTGTPSTGGLFRIGYLGGSGADQIDPILASGSPDAMRLRQLYSNLALYGEDGAVAPSLAESITQEGVNTWVVRLRDGVTFHSGKTLDADDLFFSIQRILGPDSHNTGTLGMIDPNGLKKLDNLTVELTLSTPAYYLPESFTQVSASIVPVDFDPANPVGTGPFKLKSFTPGEKVEFVRFDDYWGDVAKVDELSIQTFKDEAARVAALQGGQIDHAPLLAASFTGVVQGASNLTLHNYASGRFENVVLQTTSPEFKNPEVRRAMRMLVNRQQIVDQVYGGFASIGNDIPEPSSVYYNKDLPQWEHDIDEAMSILKSAGAADMQLEFVAADLTPTTVNMAQAVTQQFVEAGIDTKMKQIEASAYYSPDSGFGTPDRALSLDIWGGWSFATFTNLSQLPGADFNESSWENQDFLSAYKAASNTVDEAERKKHLADAQEIMHSESGTIIPAFIDVLDVYGSNVQGYKTDPLGLGGGDFNYTGISFTS